MFKDEWFAAYDSSYNLIKPRMTRDILKLKEFVKSKNMKDEIESDLERCLGGAYEGFIPKLGINPKCSSDPIYHPAFKTSRTLNRIWYSNPVLKTDNLNVGDYKFIWDTFFTKWWDQFKKVLINMVLIVDHVRNTKLTDPSSVTVQVEFGTVWSYPGFVIDVSDWNGRNKSFTMWVNLYLHPREGFDDVNNLEKYIAPIFRLAFSNEIYRDIYIYGNAEGESLTSVIDQDGLLVNSKEVMDGVQKAFQSLDK